MTPLEDVEILLVEDNPNDVELTLRALQKQNLSNKVFVVKDGAEALDFMFATGAYAQRPIDKRPRVLLFDRKTQHVAIVRSNPGSISDPGVPLVKRSAALMSCRSEVYETTILASRLHSLLCRGSSDETDRKPGWLGAADE